MVEKLDSTIHEFVFFYHLVISGSFFEKTSAFFCKTYTGLVKVNISNKYRQVSNISRTLVGNKIVDQSDVVGASPVGAVPTTS